jgi:hypothetical protein
MNEQILINVTPQETRVAIMEQGAVQELHIERVSGRGLVGNVYLGRVARVLPGMQSAFIDIGLARAAFLHVADIWSSHRNEEQKPIEKMLQEGQTLLVWSRSSRIPSAARARGFPPRSASPDGCWCFSRVMPTSAFRSASRTKPSASNCAKKCKVSYRRTKPADSSCAPSPKLRPMPNSPPTSNT